MKRRRLFALFTSVTMLHLTVVSGDAACATHGATGHHTAKTGGEEMAGHAMPMDGNAMPMARALEASTISAAPVAKSDATPCEVPTQQHCCDALVAGGCSVDSAVTSSHQTLATAVSPATRIRVAVDDAPASFAPAPEPPPPKA
jgi:hypothetical protein